MRQAYPEIMFDPRICTAATSRTGKKTRTTPPGIAATRQHAHDPISTRIDLDLQAQNAIYARAGRQSVSDCPSVYLRTNPRLPSLSVDMAHPCLIVDQ